MSLNALIVDDEPKLREVLKIKLQRHCPLVSVLGEASNITEAHQLVEQFKPNLVFLDISMPGGSGFDFLEHYDHVPFQVIFVTGYGEYAIQALKLSAVDYLLKPIVTDDLIEAVYRANLRIKEDLHSQYEVLKENHSQSNVPQKVAIPSSNGFEFVSVDEIYHLEGWDKYTRIHTQKHGVIVSSYNIGVFKDMLSDQGFIDVHKSHLINERHVAGYDNAGEVIMSNDSRIPVSRRKRDDFLEHMTRKEN